MFNILLDPLPTQWHGYRIDPDFQIGIQTAFLFFIRTDNQPSIIHQYINGNPVDFDFKDLVISILIPFLEDVIRNFVLDTKRLEGFSVRQNFSLVVKPFYMIINFSYKAKRLLFIVRENTAFLPPHQ